MKTLVDHPALSLAWVVHAFEPKKPMACFCGLLPLTLTPGGVAQLAEEPEFAQGDRHVGDDAAQPLLRGSDLIPSKPRADVVLLATAHSPQPTKSLPVTMRVGTLAKALKVYGPRSWKSGLLGRSGVGEAQPFQTLPLTYEHALGGKASELNPHGVGLDGDDAPRIENPAEPIAKPRSDQLPAGFAPLAPAWKQRASLVGTYGKKWRAERWPCLPDDFDYAYFNAAPRDQQVDGYLRGDEDLQFENLHPEHPIYKSKLPGLRLRLFVNVRTADVVEFREVPVKLDTLWIDLDKGIAALSWRGATAVRNPKMREFEVGAAWLEPLAEKPKPAEYYRERLDELTAPPPFEPPPAPFDDEAFEKSFADMNKDLANVEAEMAKFEADAMASVEAGKAEMIQKGYDPKLFDPRPDAGAGDLGTLLGAMDSLTAAQKADLQAQAAEVGKLEAEMAALDASFAKDFPPPLSRDDVLASVREGKAVGRVDLEGMDLSGQSFVGVDFFGANLAKANLSGADLSRTNFTEAILTEANLAGANLSGSRLDRADLTGAQIAGAKLDGVSLRAATVRAIDLTGAKFANCVAEEADFTKSTLNGVSFVNAKLARADFTGCPLEGSDFTGADLTRVALDGVKAKGANLSGANLAHASVSDGADLTGANLQRATAPRAVFASALLDRANLSRSSMPNAQFGDASMQEANLDRADLAGAMFDDTNLQRALLTRTNLLRASFERADLADADLEGANAYAAGFLDALMEGAKLKNVNLRRTLLG